MTEVKRVLDWTPFQLDIQEGLLEVLIVLTLGCGISGEACLSQPFYPLFSRSLNAVMQKGYSGRGIFEQIAHVLHGSWNGSQEVICTLMLRM